MNTTSPFSKWNYLLIGLLLCIQAPTRVHAEDEKTNTNSIVKFRPSVTGAASVRVTGGSRGSGEAQVTLDVLAPDGVGTTTVEQPSLFWYQSAPSQAMLEVTLLKQNQVKPVIRHKVDHATKAGIQRLKLSDLDGKLAVGVDYRWVVALVLDPENRSKDLVASGVIRRIDPAEDLKKALVEASSGARPGIYAEAGIWYDALSTLSDQIDANPGDSNLREARSDLLRQVGLNNAAADASLVN